MWDAALELIFPPRCAGCDRVGSYWCQHCAAAVLHIPYPDHITPLAPLAAVAATGTHEGILREAVQALKYSGARPAAAPLAARLAQRLSRNTWKIDMLIPVPLHASRLAERGYNQSEILSNHLALIVQIPCQPAGLRRIRNTQSQVTMSAADRLTNVQDAFEAQSELVSGQSILLVDDVYTTGSTLSACAQALLQVGAVAVYGITVTAARV